MFLEIDQDKIDRVRGMDITFVTTARNNEEGRALLKHLGFPFKATDDAKVPSARDFRRNGNRK